MSSKEGYSYLFPFEKIPPNSDILIYGAGILGQEYLKQMLITKYANVVGFIDKNHKSYPPMIVPVYPPGKIKELAFDYIVVALRMELWLPEILRIIFEQGVTVDKVVYVLERTNVQPIILKTSEVKEDNKRLAYSFGKISVALYLTGGIGDMINQKRVVMDLSMLLPEIRIDLYPAHNKSFVEWLYSDCSYVCNIILDLGMNYMLQKNKYSLSMAMMGHGFIELDKFDSEPFAENYADFIGRIEKLKAYNADQKLSITLPDAVAVKRRIYNNENCYTGFRCNGAFPISTWKISIPFLKNYEDEFNKYNLKQYFTVNIGNGSGKDGRNVAKSWPMERFQKVVDMVKNKYPNIMPIQLGVADDKLLDNISQSFMGYNFGLVAHILKNALFHLDIEGGLTHLASQIGTKCIVLFGPTSKAYYAYKNNINISVGECCDCYGYYVNGNRCARHMKEPECMYNITPEIVFEKIDSFLSKRGI